MNSKYKLFRNVMCNQYDFSFGCLLPRHAFKMHVSKVVSSNCNDYIDYNYNELPVASSQKKATLCFAD